MTFPDATTSVVTPSENQHMLKINGCKMKFPFEVVPFSPKNPSVSVEMAGGLVFFLVLLAPATQAWLVGSPVQELCQSWHWLQLQEMVKRKW